MRNLLLTTALGRVLSADGAISADANTDATPPAVKAKRARKAAKTEKATKTEKMAKAPTFNIAKVRALLKKAEVKFNSRSGVAKLVEVAAANEVDISTAENAGGGVVPAKYKKEYGKLATCGDEIAKAFETLQDKDGKIEDKVLAAVAKKNGVDYSKWAHLNHGMRRMNLSNVLRGKRQHGEEIHIGNEVLKAAA